MGTKPACPKRGGATKFSAHVCSSQLSSPAPPQKKGGAQQTHFFAHVLWPNGWIDQDATWYGGMPLSWPYCVRWGLLPPKGHTPNFRPMSVVAKRLDGSRIHPAVWPQQLPPCQDITWQGGSCLGPGDIVLDGDPAPLKRGTASRPPL